MARQIATPLLEDMSGQSPHAIERTLTRMSGVIRAYVSPVVETVYVEYDGDRCTTTDLLRAIESLGMRASVPSSDRPRSREHIMRFFTDLRSRPS